MIILEANISHENWISIGSEMCHFIKPWRPFCKAISYNEKKDNDDNNNNNNDNNDDDDYDNNDDNDDEEEEEKENEEEDVEEHIDISMSQRVVCRIYTMYNIFSCTESGRKLMIFSVAVLPSLQWPRFLQSNPTSASGANRVT